ncbi:hypothetical protein ACIBUR_10070 [Streptomyces anulatus]
MNAVVQGWTIVTQTRQQVSPDHMQGVFLATCGERWMVGRQYDGKKGTTGFSEDGEWWHARYFDGDTGTDNLLAALDAYPDAAMKAAVWDRMFHQDATESVCRFLAGGEEAGRPKLSAGWKQTEVLSGIPVTSSTIPMPFHEAKYELLWFIIWSTRLSAKVHLTKGVTMSRHEAVTLVREATGPIRFEMGYNTYWLAQEEDSTDAL